MDRLQSTLRILFIIGLIGWLNACVVQLTYNRLDWIIPWYVNDYIEFSDDQEDLFEQRLAAQLGWHRATQLKSYAERLQRFSDNLQDGLTRAELYAFTDDFRQAWQVLARQLVPDIALLLSSAEDVQITEMFDNIERRNQRFRKRHIDRPEHEIRQKRADSMHEYVEDWLGRITPEQQKAIDDWSRHFQLTGAVVLDYRRNWQRQLHQALHRRREPDSFRTALQDLMLDPENAQPQQLRQMREHNLERFFDLILRLDELMNSEQRAFLSRKILSLAGDFDDLAQLSQ